MYKALISDFDGTLATCDKRVSTENLKAIDELFSLGKKFALCTGRMTASAMTVVKKLPFRPLIATYNGGEIVDSSTGKVLKRYVLDTALILKLLQFGKARGLHYHIFSDEVIVEKVDEIVDFYCSICLVKPNPVGDLYDYVLKTGATSPKLMFITSDGDVSRYIKEILDLFGDQVEAVRCYKGMIDITPKGINKGSAVKDFCEIWGITPSECVAVGDEGNDVAMFKTAGVGVAMVNALPDVKAHADYVTKNTNDESGVAEVIRKFF